MRISWEPKHQSAFKQLKAWIAPSTILASPAFDQPFTLYANASEIGAGVVLTHVLRDVKHVMALASHTFSTGNSSRYATERECMAILWAVE